MYNRKYNYLFHENDIFFFRKISELNEWLEHLLNNFIDEDEAQSGRLGPYQTVFDIDNDNDILASVNISDDRLTIQSQSAFATVRANVAVFSGKWMYEVSEKLLLFKYLAF